MKVLITGSTGFLGRNLAEYLAGKHDLLLPGRKQLDLLDSQAVKKYLSRHLPDAVIHAAGVGIVRTENTNSKSTQDNLKMFYNLADCGQYFTKMLFCGSGAVYDKSKDIVNIKEEAFGQSEPQDPYGRYKYECSKFIERSQNIIDLRLFGVFGRYEDYATRFISNAICRALLGLPINIFQNVKFEYLYADDFVKLAGHFISHPARHKAYNAGTGKPVDLLALARKVEQAAGKKLTITVKNPGWNKEYTCDNGRLMQELPDFEFTPLDTGIKELYNWYQGRLAQIDSQKL